MATSFNYLPLSLRDMNLKYFSFFQVKQYRDFIAMLPEQLAIRIFSFLVPKELLVVCQVRAELAYLSLYPNFFFVHDGVIFIVFINSDPLKSLF